MKKVELWSVFLFSGFCGAAANELWKNDLYLTAIAVFPIGVMMALLLGYAHKR